jgi:D-glycero-D-manno-heptose 1,7-bisphosphate phosphatase
MDNRLERAIFMDRDGTLLDEIGYMYHSGLYRALPWTTGAVRRINESGMRAVLITNQSGIGRGYFPESTVHEVHRILHRDLAEEGAHLDAIYFCPHRPDENCGCRKPRPGMLLQASLEMKIDLSRSFMIGDRYSDIKAGAAAGAKSILVCTGDGRKEIEQYGSISDIQPDYIAENLLHAVEAILSGEVS